MPEGASAQFALDAGCGILQSLLCLTEHGVRRSNPEEHLASQNVWQRLDGEERKIGKTHLVVTLILVTIGAAFGAYGSYLFPLGFGATFFWPGIAVQNVGGIWCGAWGIIASSVFPLISNSVVGTSVSISLKYIPANAVQSLVPAWAFRHFKADPGLRSRKDWGVFLGSITVGNALGAIWASQVVLRNQTASRILLGWFIGNEVASLVLSTIFLVILSPVVVGTKWFVKGWWS